jgi:hypothetical protein
MKKFWIVFLIFYLTICSCSTIKNHSFPDYSKNIEIVKSIIKNYDNLDVYLNNFDICDSIFLKYKIKYESKFLKEHIIKNKFYEGYNFEIIDDLAYGQIGSEPISFQTHRIKMRSNFNNDIIWFSFTTKIGEKKWKLNSFDFCNNPEQMVWGEDVPCDKK